MAPTTFTSIVMVAFAVVVLTIAPYAWFGDREPRRTPDREDRLGAAVEALRRSVDAYERENRGT